MNDEQKAAAAAAQGTSSGSASPQSPTRHDSDQLGKMSTHRHKVRTRPQNLNPQRLAHRLKAEIENA